MTNIEMLAIDRAFIRSPFAFAVNRSSVLLVHLLREEPLGLLGSRLGASRCRLDTAGRSLGATSCVLGPRGGGFGALHFLLRRAADRERAQQHKGANARECTYLHNP